MYHSVVKVKKNRRLEFLKIKLQSSICFYEVVANICLQKVMQQVVHSKKCGVHSTPSSCHTIRCVSHQRNFGVLCTPSCGVTGFWCA